MSSISDEDIPIVLQCPISYNLEITKELKDQVDTIVAKLEEVEKNKFITTSCNGPTYYKALAHNSFFNVTEDYCKIQRMRLEAFKYWFSDQDNPSFGIATIVFNELFISDTYDKISFDIACSYIF